MDKVYLVGKLAKGHESDLIDLILVGNNLNKPFLMEQIEKAERKIGKKIRYMVFSKEEFDISKIKEPGFYPLLLWVK